MAQKEFGIVLDAMEKVSAAAGEKVITQGEDGKNLYFRHGQERPSGNPRFDNQQVVGNRERLELTARHAIATAGASTWLITFLSRGSRKRKRTRNTPANRRIARIRFWVFVHGTFGFL